MAAPSLVDVQKWRIEYNHMLSHVSLKARIRQLYALFLVFSLKPPLF